MERDEAAMAKSKSKAKGRKRDPGVAWILDFDNDGIASYEVPFLSVHEKLSAGKFSFSGSG